MLDDGQIRAIMHDAEEKVPSRVWSSVSSRLETVSEPAPSPVWRWAGAGIAFAAVATGIFFIGTSYDRSGGTATAGQIAQVVEIAPAGTGDAAEAASALIADAIVPSPKEYAAYEDVADIAAEIRVPAEDGKAVAASPASPATLELSESSEMPEQEVLPTQEAAVPVKEDFTEPDPFAALEEEQSRGTVDRRMRLIVGGLAGGNRAGQSGTSTMSSGTQAAPSSDVISETSNSSYGIPFTVGVGVCFNIAPKLFIGTGVDYSLLTRTFDGTYTAAGSMVYEKGSVRNHLHYIGIPVKLFYDVIEHNNMEFYAYGGCEVEWCVSDRMDFRPAAGGDAIVKHIGVGSPQFSVGGGLGVQFNLTGKVGLYLDPGINYYFYCSQPKSIRTERPLMFNLSAGVRFAL